MFNLFNRKKKKKDKKDKFDIDKFISNIKNKYEDSSVISNCNTTTTIITNYINNKVALDTILRKEGKELNSLNIYIKLSTELDVKHDCITKENKFMINDIPIQLNPWRIDRVFNQFFLINDKKIISIEHKKYNISNTYLYPMNFIMCEGANHAQFAAISKGKGESFFKDMYDFSKLYDLCRFDGSNFIDNNNNIININYYSFQEILYAGILFEIGRVRLEEGFKNPYI